MDATHYYKVSMESPFMYFFTHREVFQQLLKSQLGSRESFSHIAPLCPGFLLISCYFCYLLYRAADLWSRSYCTPRFLSND